MQTMDEKDIKNLAIDFFGKYPQLMHLKADESQEIGPFVLSVHPASSSLPNLIYFKDPHRRNVKKSDLEQVLDLVRKRATQVSFIVNSFTPPELEKWLVDSGFKTTLETRGVFWNLQKKLAVGDPELLQERVETESQREQFAKGLAEVFAMTPEKAGEVCRAGYFKAEPKKQKFNFLYKLRDASEFVGISAYSVFEGYEALGYGTGLGVLPPLQTKGWGRRIVMARALEMKKQQLAAFVCLAYRTTSLPLFLKMGAEEVFRHDVLTFTSV